MGLLGWQSRRAVADKFLQGASFQCRSGSRCGHLCRLAPRVFALWRPCWPCLLSSRPVRLVPMAASAEAPIVARGLVVLAELAFWRSPAPTAPRADRTPAAAVAAGPAAAQAAKAAVALVGRAAPEARLEHRMDRRAGTAAEVVAEAVVAAATTETVPARRASPTRLRL